MDESVALDASAPQSGCSRQSTLLLPHDSGRANDTPATSLVPYPGTCACSGRHAARLRCNGHGTGQFGRVTEYECTRSTITRGDRLVQTICRGPGRYDLAAQPDTLLPMQGMPVPKIAKSTSTEHDLPYGSGA